MDLFRVLYQRASNPRSPVSAIIELFQVRPLFYLSAIFMLGLVVGSFLNVVILRLPLMLQRDWKAQCSDLLGLEAEQEAKAFNLVTPRSHCPRCRHGIRASENIPLLSYLLLRGRCAQCEAAISPRYPLIELAAALMAVMAAVRFGVSPEVLFAMALGWALLALAVIDLEHQLLPDDITLPFLWLGIALNFFNVFTDLHASVLGAILGYGALWSVYIVYKLVTGKAGMGHGDFKLLALLGAWLGWQLLPLIIISASLLGAIIGIGMIIFRAHDKDIPIPFGPYLAIGGWIAMLWGPAILSLYLNSFA